ncbi:uncharacterized protein LOC116300212 [Actinia tenebrosa]|uniref:Uncharacterized protein LOC116300212 n=1 Tax=Actinia tenebrosa TaxID=6105 RepID=A0A6P8IBW0_ACTTE|nr:uncharacterized protein LOC116300212 [Actinia tenebrosa]
MFPLISVLWFVCLSSTSGDTFMGKLFSKGSNGSPTSLTNSAIAMWMQRSGLARRVCQRGISVHTYDSSVSARSASVVTGQCEIQFIKSSAGVPLSPDQKPCPGMQACVPTMSEIINLRTTNGISDVTSAINCACAPKISGCHRRRRLRVFYRNTKFERVVDVGECAGNCGQNRCQPLAIKTVAIKSPNGRKSVEVVEKCGCAHSCYRISYKKAYQVLTKKQKSNATETKVIDIGTCSSSSVCTGHVQGKCLYWAKPVVTSQQTSPFSVSSSSEKVCLLRTKGRPRGCYAEKTRVITLNTLQEPNMKVTVIDSCTCS